MNFDELLRDDRLRQHKTSQQEIKEMLYLVDRDLIDASVEGLSSDRRFMIAYDPVLTLATIPLYCAGYRTHGAGHHWTVFLTLPLSMSPEQKALASYLDSCRNKRNISSYDRSGRITDGEAAELLEEAIIFKSKIEAWLRDNHPEFSPE